MRLKTTGLLIAAAVASSWGGMAARAAAPATPQGFINYYTYPDDQRAAALAGTAVADGSYYPKRAEGPYNGIPDADPGDDDTPPAGDVRNNYTLHLKGYWYAPKNGKIQLALACDDPGELYFSTDDNPANRVRVATESQWNPVRAFGGAWDGSVATRRTVVSAGDAPVPRPENWSKFIDVVQGKPYYIEAWAVEFGGGDNLAIAVRYDSDAEFADGDKPILGAQLSAFSVPAAPVITAQPQDAYLYAGSAAAFSVGIDAPPGATISSTKWQKNGTDIPDSNALILSLPTTAADDGAKVKAIITTSGGVLTSAEATVNVATLVSGFAPGLVRWDAFREIGGNSVDNLTDDPKYQANTPDETRIFTSFEAPVNIYEAFGGRLSGIFIPPANGNYVFFMSCDDNGALYLSTDDNPANKKKIAAETTWSNNREWIISGGNSDLASKRSDQYAETEWGGNTITLQANKNYYLELLYKEGGGGDNGSVTVIREGEPDPASGTATILTGSLVGATAKPDKGDPQITKQPVFPAQLEEGRRYSFNVDAVVTPTGFNFTPSYQWQKNGTAIPGATGKTLNIASAAAADAGTYRAVVTAPSGKSVNSTESAALAVVPDTFAPVPSAGGLLKGGKQEIGVGFDEAVNIGTANVLANYSLSAGTIDSVRVVNRAATGFDASLGVTEYNGVVLLASGLTAGQTYQLTVKNVADAKGNAIPAAGVNVSFKAEGQKTWSVVGANQPGFANDVVRHGDGSFDVVSGGVGFWADYDEATFVNEKVTGNFDAKVQLIEQDPSTQWARTGLMAREALDEGKIPPVRGDTTVAFENGEYTIPKEQLFSRLQTVHANPTKIWDPAGVAANNAFENHWRSDVNANGAVNGTYAAPWGNQMDSADGGFGPLDDGSGVDYPNLWMRLQRDGDFLVTYRSSDGENWTQMTRREFVDLADDLFIGPFFGPELVNNGAQAGIGHAVLAKFRNYSITTGAIPPPPGDLKFTAFSLTGGKLHLEWTGDNAKLQSADAVTGPWADVPGATSPRDVDPTGAGTFYRLVGQ